VELLSEEEQWERLKAWLRTNGLSVLVLAALMLLGWFGWHWWKDRNQQQAVSAGEAYQTVLAQFDEGKLPEAYALIETLRSEYPKSPYVNAADLAAANMHVAANELDKAAERLKRVADGALDEQLRPIARLRLARVQASMAQYDAAMATLGTAEMGVHEPARLEVRGDVLYAQGDREGALKEYQASRKLLPVVELDEGGVGELLDLKIADLGGTPEAAPPAAEAAAPAAVTPPVETP
jgi:predicted negative regulator of RcsB-dependent stress response